MSRTVELEEVIRALEGGKGDGGRGKGETPPPTLRDSAPAAAAVPIPLSAPPRPPDRPAAGPPETGPLTLDRMQALWPQIVADARAKSQLLGTLVAATAVVAAEGKTLTIRMLEANSVHVEGLERQRETLAQIVGRYLTEPVRVAFATETPTPPSRPPRLTEEGARADRLSRLRAGDARLDAAAEAFDLELLE